MHEDTRIDHKLSSSTVVKTMFTHDSQYFHVRGVALTNKINKNVTSLELFGIPGWRIQYFPY